MTAGEVKKLSNAELVYKLANAYHNLASEFDYMCGISDETYNRTDILLTECKERGLMTEEYARDLLIL